MILKYLQTNLPVHWLSSKGSHQSLKSALLSMKDVLLRDAINPVYDNTVPLDLDQT